jgi:hypothetical protein
MAAPEAKNPPPEGAPPVAVTQERPASQAEQSYSVRLRDLERRVNELKEQVFRSKARLNLLKETVLHGVIAGSRAIIVHKNEMSSMYQAVQYVYALDGNEIFSRADESGKLGKEKEIEIYNGSLTPGNHTLSVTLIYIGAGFPYMKGYKFTTRSSHTFTATEGKQIQLKVVGYEKGNPVTTDPADRPSVDFRENIISDRDAAAKTTEPAKK